MLPSPAIARRNCSSWKEVISPFSEIEGRPQRRDHSAVSAKEVKSQTRRSREKAKRFIDGLKSDIIQVQSTPLLRLNSGATVAALSWTARIRRLYVDVQIPRKSQLNPDNISAIMSGPIAVGCLSAFGVQTQGRYYQSATSSINVRVWLSAGG